MQNALKQQFDSTCIGRVTDWAHLKRPLAAGDWKQKLVKAENHAIDSPRKVSEPAKGPDLLYIHLLSGSIIAPQLPAANALEPLHEQRALE